MGCIRKCQVNSFCFYFSFEGYAERSTLNGAWGLIVKTVECQTRIVEILL